MFWLCSASFARTFTFYFSAPLHRHRHSLTTFQLELIRRREVCSLSESTKSHTLRFFFQYFTFICGCCPTLCEVFKLDRQFFLDNFPPKFAVRSQQKFSSLSCRAIFRYEIFTHRELISRPEFGALLCVRNPIAQQRTFAQDGSDGTVRSTETYL